jgi:hypothetical protein
MTIDMVVLVKVNITRTMCNDVIVVKGIRDAPGDSSFSIGVSDTLICANTIGRASMQVCS